MWKKGQSGNPSGRRLKKGDDWLPGETKEDRVKRRARERTAAWLRNNPERAKKLAAIGRQRRKGHWKEFLAQERERYAQPHIKAKKLAREKRQRELHPERRVAVAKRAYLKAPHKFAAYCAKRRAVKQLATPQWVSTDDLIPFYEHARALTRETGIPHEVDHIMPLRGKAFTGLHVPWNLQVLPRKQNRSKLNKVVHGSAIQVY